MTRRIIQKVFWIGIITVFLSLTLTSSSFAVEELIFRKMQAGGLERSYYLHLPARHEAAGKLPVVFVLHGGGRGNGDDIARWSGYRELADRENFIAVYPNGIDAQWNDGRIKTFQRAKESAEVDDVGFISALIDLMVRDFRGDPERIYITGLSNGGMMALRLGCEISQKLAAIAPVIANMPENIYGTCMPEHKLPVLLMNGTDDPLVPWDGGSVGYFGKRRGKVVSTNETIRFWKTHNGCNTGIVAWLPDRDRKDGSRVRVTTWRNQDRSCEVVLYRVEGGGHTFPGSDVPDRRLLLGRKNNDIDGPGVIWSFFKKHKR